MSKRKIQAQQLEIERHKHRARIQKKDVLMPRVSSALVTQHMDRAQADRINSCLISAKKLSKYHFRRQQDATERERQSRKKGNRVNSITIPYFTSYNVANNIKWKIPSEQDKREPSTSNTSLLHDELFSFAEYLCLTPRETQLRETVLRDLVDAVLSKWPKAAINVFGSFPSGLSIYSSDLDISVQNVGVDMDYDGQSFLPQPRPLAPADTGTTLIAMSSAIEKSIAAAEDLTEEEKVSWVLDCKPAVPGGVPAERVLNTVSVAASAEATVGKKRGREDLSECTKRSNEIIDLTGDDDEEDETSSNDDDDDSDENTVEEEDGDGDDDDDDEEEDVDDGSEDWEEEEDGDGDDDDNSDDDDDRIDLGYEDEDEDDSAKQQALLDEDIELNLDQGNAESSFVPSSSNVASNNYDTEKRMKLLMLLKMLSGHLQSMGWCKDIQVRPRARIPIIALTHRSGVSIDISLGVSAQEHSLTVSRMVELCGYNNFYPLCSFLKVFLAQLDLDKPFTGGVGSFKLYAMITAIFPNTLSPANHSSPSNKSPALPPNPNLAHLLSHFFRHWGSPSKLNADTTLSLRLPSLNSTQGEVLQVAFDRVFKVQELQEAFQRAGRVLDSALSRPFDMQFPNSSSWQRVLPTFVGRLVEIAKLTADRTSLLHAAGRYSLYSMHDKLGVAREILSALHKKLQFPHPIPIERLYAVNAALVTRLLSYSNAQEALQHGENGKGTSCISKNQLGKNRESQGKVPQSKASKTKFLKKQKKPKKLTKAKAKMANYGGYGGVVGSKMELKGYPGKQKRSKKQKTC